MNNDYALPGLRTAYQDGSEDVTSLLNEVLDAHGGLAQWKRFTKMSATIRLRRNSTARLYQLIRQKGPIVDRTFEIEFFDLGVHALDFTFG